MSVRKFIIKRLIKKSLCKHENIYRHVQSTYTVFTIITVHTILYTYQLLSSMLVAYVVAHLKTYEYSENITESYQKQTKIATVTNTNHEVKSIRSKRCLRPTIAKSSCTK